MQTTVLTTDQKGAIAESAIVHAAIRLGAGVLTPFVGGLRYDLILDLAPRLLRVQCKYVDGRDGVLAVPVYTSRRTREGLRRRKYTAQEIDAIAVYAPEIERCFLLLQQIFDGRSMVQLRLAPSLNGQHAGINWASDFDFDATLMRLMGP